MKCYISFSKCPLASEFGEDLPDIRKVTVYGEKVALLNVVDALGHHFVLSHVDMVEDKKKENIE